MERQTKKAKTEGNKIQGSEKVYFVENSTDNVVQGSDYVTLVRSTDNVVQGSDEVRLVDSKKCVVQGSDVIQLYNCENVKVQGCDEMDLTNVKNRTFKDMKGIKYDAKTTTEEELEQMIPEYVPYKNLCMTTSGNKTTYQFPKFSIECNTTVTSFTSNQITLDNGFRITIEKKS